MSLMSPALGLSDPSDPPAHAPDWALVDVETSGLVPRRDRVLSVAVVTLGPDGEPTGEFATLLNPGCDPGPTHIHGLTAERLRGAPTFDRIADRIGALLRGRVFVAHNAQFDYDFLAHEFARARMSLPVTRRLCTLALNRRIEPPTGDLTLGSLAAHYGVPQARPHDALDDARVLGGVFRATLREAARLDVPLPLVACPPRQDPRFAPKPPKSTCAYRNPGPWTPGGPLVQGMKIAVTGPTVASRAELVERAVAAGLNVMGSVSRRTSLLVTNDASSASAKARRARAEGVPIVDEATFLGLLDAVRPGVPHAAEAPATLLGAAAAARTTRAAAPPGATGPGGPADAVSDAVSDAEADLAGRRVLVLGGPHDAAVAARARVVERGAAAAVNLSAGVTDVVLLAGGDADRRMRRIADLGLPTHDAAWLTASPAGRPAPGTAEPRGAALVLPRGGVVDLPAENGGAPPTRWAVTASWEQRTTCEIDVVAFVLDQDEQVAFDEDFVFYGAPENPGSTVRLLGDGPTEQTVEVTPATLPPSAHRVVVAAAIDGAATFGEVGAIQISAAPGPSAPPLVQATLDAATSERTLVLAEVYRRGPRWRLRAVGQGYDHGLADLARRYGVEVDD
ncbi:DNA polymerase III [Streptomyces sp. 3MP-14]|uniref:DNA polymerase III n=1 Tax=Streptomyces mimosae TaxID=2586635 RepID=A0A5N6A4Q2_9ACTN|nr:MULTISPECIES: TerD family protein [Streptomyces]KAB8162896.1 DNA polymerase III [Streptomyces mimosae]KAB8179109.1 DNA polymerase III [Streptomyces sp. 3MP-14]